MRRHCGPGRRLFDGCRQLVKINVVQQQGLWRAILNSTTHTARREWNGQPWYVTWTKVPIGRDQAMRYRVATPAGESWQDWQVATITQVETILCRAWLTDQTEWRQVWPGWWPLAESLEQITGPLQYRED